jgi:microcystin-dependent protein
MSEPFLAEVRILPYNFAPTGWALCQGQLLPISQYTAVFSLIGTYYGGNGTSNFALPNLQGRVVVGVGQGPGLSAYNPGDTEGVESVTLTAPQLAAHNHGAAAVHDAGNSYSPAGDAWSADGANRAKIYGAGAPTVAMGANALAPAGGNQPHNNLQPYIAINYCIALTGIFPPRR